MGAALAAADGADQPGIEQCRCGIALDPVLEIGGDLEQVGEFLVMGAEQVVERRRPDQHDLDVERDRLRRERHRARHAQQLLQGFDADLAGVQRPFQRRPAEIAGQQLLRVKDQIAAIGPVQSARHQQIEIGNQCAKPREMLDPADQGLMRRVVLIDDGRPLLRAIVDDDVDLIAAEAGYHRAPARLPAASAPAPSTGGAGRKSSAFSLMSCSTASRYCPTSRRSAKPARSSRIRWAIAKPVVSRLSTCSASRCSRSHCGTCRMIASSWFCTPSISCRMRSRSSAGSASNISGATTLPSRGGARPSPIGVRINAIPLLFGLLLQGTKCLFATLLELLVERVAADPVFIALEGGGQGGAQFLDQIFHRGGEAGTAARRQLQRRGCCGSAKLLT